MRWARSQELSRAVRMAPWCHSSQGHQEPETHTQVLACGERIRSSPVPPPPPPPNPPNFRERRGKSKCLGDLQKDGQVFAGSILILLCPGPKAE